MKAENGKLRQQQKKQERYNRKSNVLMKGFMENSQGQESRFDCKKKVLSMLCDAGIDLPPMAIELAVRIGENTSNNRARRNRSKPVDRPMLVRFLHIEDRDNVLIRRDLVYNKCGIQIDEDFPPDIQDKRRELRPLMLSINNKRVNGRIKYRASIWEDKLIVNGKQYSVETLDKLPEDISTINLSTPRNNNMVAFFSKYSPLSNYHQCQETVDGRTFSCQEQYYTYI